MPDHTHDDDGDPCAFHGLFESNMEAFTLVAALVERIGPPMVSPPERMMVWVNNDGDDPWMVEVALGHGRPVVSAVGDSRETDLARGVCARLDVSCLDEDGDVVAGPPPAVDPWGTGREEAEPRGPKLGVIEGGGGKPN